MTWVENPRYCLEVTYEYSVGGVRYSGDTVSFSGEEWPKKEAAQELLGRFSEGKAVSVYFDASEPENSVLIPGGRRLMNSFVGILMGLFLLWVAWASIALTDP